VSGGGRSLEVSAPNITGGRRERQVKGPDPSIKHPMAGFPRVCFMKNTVSNPNIIIGDYTYYDDSEDSENFERNVLYHYPFVHDKLIIGSSVRWRRA
jgi:virginiamycin A acetyltransferase